MSASANNAIQDARKCIRKAMRTKRQQLSTQQQKLASQGFTRQLHRSGLLLKGQHIALYIGNDGELNPWPLLPKLIAQKKSCYLPFVHPRQQGLMQFVKTNLNTPMQRNRYGIAEPMVKNGAIKAQFLSLVLMPLVAFDLSGNRLGMGGGYYDRAFSIEGWPYHDRHTKLIGVAHECQKHEGLPSAHWDVPLDGVLTERAFYQFS